MPNPSYIKKCERLLTDFENTQAEMLQLDFKKAGEDFLIQMKQMRENFKKILIEIAEFSFQNSKDQILINKQIERLLVFLKEMDLHMRGFHSKPPPDETEIIFIFERQHLFKNIFRKHLKDFASKVDLID
jgi:hypothetical protein